VVAIVPQLHGVGVQNHTCKQQQAMHTSRYAHAVQRERQQPHKARPLTLVNALLRPGVRGAHPWAHP
jgi:hypothetical protein